MVKEKPEPPSPCYSPPSSPTTPRSVKRRRTQALVDKINSEKESANERAKLRLAAKAEQAQAVQRRKFWDLNNSDSDDDDYIEVVSRVAVTGAGAAGSSAGLDTYVASAENIHLAAAAVRRAEPVSGKVARWRFDVRRKGGIDTLDGVFHALVDDNATWQMLEHRRFPFSCLQSVAWCLVKST